MTLRRAREQLEAVQLPPGRGSPWARSNICSASTYEGAGDAASAQRSFQAAAASGGLLTEDGPAIKGLAERKLVGRGVGSPKLVRTVTPERLPGLARP